MLEIKELDSGYGKKQVLYRISISVAAGEIVALIGPNGAGKSTVLKVVHGSLRSWQGNVIFNGERLDGATPAARVSKGITFAPQGNRVFPGLTVTENLEIGGCQLPKKELRSRIDAVLQFFPILADRRKQLADRLSGGEQQMLALGRALVPQPRLLLLDEPSLGLSPDVVLQVFEKIVGINRNTGTSILIVEQKVREVLRICHRVYSLRLGRVAYEGSPAELSNDTAKVKSLFL